MHPYILCFIVDIHSTCLKLFYIRSYINYFDCCFCMTFSLSALEICFFFHACWNAFSSIVSTILTMLPLFWSFLKFVLPFCSVFQIGHVTKSGDIAGPRVLEHIVDVVLYMEVGILLQLFFSLNSW